MPVSKRGQLRRHKRKFTRFKFQLRNGNKSKYYYQGLADGKAGYTRRYGWRSMFECSSQWYKCWSDYNKGYIKSKDYLIGS